MILTSLYAPVFCAFSILFLKMKEPPTHNQEQLKAASVYAKKFEKTQETEFLKESSRALENVVLDLENNLKDRKNIRKKTLCQWLRLLNLIDCFIYPDFNADDVLELLVQPPPSSELGGVVLRPGADPSQIDDPKARAEYKKAIADNKNKTVYYTFQIKLHRLDKDITFLSEKFIHDHYTLALEDQEELKKAIKKTIKNAKRKAKMTL